MLKKLLFASLFCCAGPVAHAGNTPLVLQIDRTLSPSPICVNRLSSGACTVIGYVNSANAWTPLGPGGVPFAASAFTDTTDAGNISKGTLSGNRLPGPGPTVRGGVLSGVAPTNQFQNGVNSDGSGAYSQPTFAGLAGSLSSGQIPSGLTIDGPILTGAPKTPGFTGYLYGNGGTGWTASPSIPATALSGTIDCLREPLQTGDVSSPAGSCAFTLGAGVVTAPKIAPGAASANIGTLGGDLGGTLPNPTISSGVVSNGKLANVPASSLKCGVSAGAPIDCTGAQAAAIVSPFLPSQQSARPPGVGL